MNPVILGEAERTQIRSLVERAFANPVPLSRLEAQAAAGERVDDPSTRNPLTEAMQDEMSVTIPSGYKVVFTVEQQPSGMFRHMSMSSPDPKKVPTPVAVQLLMDEIGFETPITACLVYPERFSGDHVAINVLEKISA